jgi:hypothetical protein
MFRSSFRGRPRFPALSGGNSSFMRSHCPFVNSYRFISLFLHEYSFCAIFIFQTRPNLYGVIPLRKAWEIVSDQNTDLVSKEEFFTFAEIARHECEDYCIMKDDELYLDGKPTGRLDWKIIDISLLYDEDDALHEVEVCQQGKGSNRRKHGSILKLRYKLEKSRLLALILTD